MNIDELRNGDRCLSCWQTANFNPVRCSSQLASHNDSSHNAPLENTHNAPPVLTTPCHFIKGPFSHKHGQIIDNSSLLLRKLASLYNNADLSDVTVVVGGSSYYAHKLILSSCSEVFKIMLMSDSWSDHNKDRIVLQEEEECVAVFPDFLSYLYTGLIHLSHDNVLYVLMLADKYNVIDLQVVCCDYMISHLVSTVSHNQVVSWYQYATLTNHTVLETLCEQFITWNFRKIASTKYFYDMEGRTLELFLQSSDLVIQDEYTLFEILAKWLRHSSRDLIDMDIPMERLDVPVRVCDSDALRMLSHIRFPMMPPQHLIQLEQEPLARHYTQFFIERIEQAMKVHYCAEEERAQHLGPGEAILLRARCYDNSTWSQHVDISQYRALPQYDVTHRVFSSPVSGAQADENRTWPWKLDLHPKGVVFNKCVCVGYLRKLEVPGSVLEIFRLVLKKQDAAECCVDVSVLVYAGQDRVEYVKKVVSKRCFFDQYNSAFNLDGIISLSDLCDYEEKSPLFVGKFGHDLKLTVIIKPV